MNDENEVQTKIVPVAAVMGLLNTNTMQRNNAEYSLQQSQNKVRTQQALHIKTLGRLYKHQGAEIIDEVLEYAKQEGMFISCDSEKIGILSIIKDYTNKQKNTFQAHFTIYGKYIDKVGKDNLVPKSYKGYFLYKNYEEQFKKYINYNVTEFDKIEDLFYFEKKEPEYCSACGKEECAVNIEYYEGEETRNIIYCSGCCMKSIELRDKGIVNGHDTYIALMKANPQLQKKKCCVCSKMNIWRIICFKNKDDKKDRYWCANCFETSWT